MYCYIEVGGKQYKVEENKKLKLKNFCVNLQIKDKLVFKPIVLIDQEGKFFYRPEDVVVEAELIAFGKEKKKYVGKFRHRKRYSRKIGFRTPYSVILVKKIQTPFQSQNDKDKNNSE